MKQIFTLLLVFAALASEGQRNLITFVPANGSWSNAANWTPARVPTNNDSVVVPQSRSVVFDQATSYANMYVKIAGELLVENTMNLDASSAIELTATGLIRLYTGGNTAVEQILIANVVKFDESSNNPTTGPSAATAYSNGFGPVSVLPVTFTSFTAVRENNQSVNLAWSTAQEINAAYYEVQRSFDDHNWTVIGTVAGAGTSSLSHSYSYVDKNIHAHVVYYRIREVDMNSRSEFTSQKMVQVDGTTASPAKVYGYNKNVVVEFSVLVKNNTLIRVSNLNGQLIAQQTVQSAVSRTNLSLNQINAGIYVVQVTDGQTMGTSTKIIL